MDLQMGIQLSHAIVLLYLGISVCPYYSEHKIKNIIIQFFHKEKSTKIANSLSFYQYDYLYN